MTSSLHVDSSDSLPSLNHSVQRGRGRRRPHSPAALFGGAISNTYPAPPVNVAPLMKLERKPKKSKTKENSTQVPQNDLSDPDIPIEPLRYEPRVFGGLEALRHAAPAPRPSADIMNTNVYARDSNLHNKPHSSPHLAASTSFSPKNSSDSLDHSPPPSVRKGPWLGGIINKAIPRRSPPPNIFTAHHPLLWPPVPRVPGSRIRSKSMDSRSQSVHDHTDHRGKDSNSFDYDRVLDICPNSPSSIYSCPSPEAFVENLGDTSDDESEMNIMFPTTPGHITPPVRVSSRFASPFASPSPGQTTYDVDLLKKTPFPVVNMDDHVSTAARKGRSYSDAETPTSTMPEATILTPVRSQATHSMARPEMAKRAYSEGNSRTIPSVIIDAPLHRNPIDDDPENDWNFNEVSSAPAAVPRRLPPLPPLAIHPPMRGVSPQPKRESRPPFIFPSHTSPQLSTMGLLGVHKNERRHGWSGEWTNANDIQQVISQLRKLK